MRHLWALILSLSGVAVAVSCGGGSATSSSTGGHTGGAGGNGGGGNAGGGSSTSSTGEGGNVFMFDAGSDACTSAITCADVGAMCGMIDDGCGNVIDCGSTCPDGETCGGAGTPNVCGKPPCTPKTCADQGIACGPAGDGCGDALDCGTCTAPDTCGGGGTPSVCGHASMCTPKTCADLGFDCGPAGDGCGNPLDCGSTCPSGQTCGGGGQPGVCGAPVCVPTTCAALGVNCGPVADGCGGLLQCGSCMAPQTCGGAGMPNVCGIPSSCTNLCLSQVTCSNPNVTTTISGTVYAPNGVDPLPNALVYVPNGTVQPFTQGVSCDNCGASASGSPLVSAVTGVDGTFVIKNAPATTNVPLVVQIGRWRRQTTIANVTACVDNPVLAAQTRLPKNKSEGDIPLMAFATGWIDALECVMRKIGISDTEFTKPNGTGRIHLYVGNGNGGWDYEGGANAGNNTPVEDSLWGSQATLNKYDMVLLACQGANYPRSSTAQNRLVNYANAGGRIFTTHYSYMWLFNVTPFSSTADWSAAGGTFPSASLGTNESLTGVVDQTFPKGQILAQWLKLVGASTTLGQIPLQFVRHDTDGSIPPSQTWLYVNDPAQAGATVPMHYTFNTPVGSSPAQQCGRVSFDDFHVEDTTPLGFWGSNELTFPAECVPGAMTPQEKLLEYMLFDLASCVTPDIPMCTAKTCAELGATCGQAGDGCGGVIDCGTCPSGQTCSGTPSTCHPPMCTQTTCAQLGYDCGPAGDGCGGVLDCGTCPAGQTCGGGGKPGVCGNLMCTPKTCAQQNIQCGPAGDGCGNLIQCGTCPAGQTCGGGGQPGVCGAPMCTPKTCAELNANCGSIADGCGHLLDCGTCQPPQTCGGGGVANKCGGGTPG